jgi:hypothetical protein
MVAGLVSAVMLASLAFAPVEAANTRVTYFGSAPCPGGAATCPGGSSWSFGYPYGTGGGFTSSGQPIAGQNSFSPVASGSATATDIVLTNADNSTLTQIQINGGSQAPTAYNAASVPVMPAPGDPAFLNADGTVRLPSLPAGLAYLAVYVVNNPSSLGVSCTLSSTTGSANLFDGLHCAIANMAAGQTVTLRVVLAAQGAASTLEPWFELGLKEGASTTGSNSDTFFSYSMLTISPASCDSATSYFLDTQSVGLSNQTGVDNPCPQGTGVTSGSVIGGVGTLAVVGVRNPSQACPKSISCFGQESFASVLGGAPVPGGLQWTITWSPLPTNGNPKGVIHELANYDPSNPSTYVLIAFTGKDKCSATLTTNCWVSAGSITGGFQAVVRTPSNSGMRGY